MKKRLLLAVAVLTGMFLLSTSIVWAAPVSLAKTGQTTSYRTGDDGDHETGVATSPRFTDNGDQTVTDNLTGLMWAKDANLNGTMNWNEAIDYANNLSLGTSCGTPLTDWRLPNRNELNSLVDVTTYGPALPAGHPFNNVQNLVYWTSTTMGDYRNRDRWVVNMIYGHVGDLNWNNYLYAWPVRSDN
jgi:hypothetical protein